MMRLRQAFYRLVLDGVRAAARADSVAFLGIVAIALAVIGADAYLWWSA